MSNNDDTRLGLAPNETCLTVIFDPASTVDLREVERAYKAPCDVVIVAVPLGKAEAFEQALWREMGHPNYDFEGAAA